MRFRVSPDMAVRYPQLRIGYLVALGVDNSRYPAALAALTAHAAKEALVRFPGRTLPDHPHIRAWRAVYESFGCSWSKHPPTVESLLRRLATSKELPNVNAVVDSYLVAESEHVLPVGGYDIDHLVGDVVLRLSDGNEEFVPLSSQTTQLTLPGEVVYCDSEGILTRRWNHKDCERTRITTHTRRVVLFSEAPVSSIETPALQAVIERTAALMRESCGGEITTAILDVAACLEHAILPEQPDTSPHAIQNLAT